MSGPSYQITFQFSSYDSMLKHLEKNELYFRAIEQESILVRKQTAIETDVDPLPKPKLIRENDRRGRHTKSYHDMAREYHDAHPEIPYRECYRAVVAERKNT